MKPHSLNLAALVVFNIALAYHRHHAGKHASADESLAHSGVDREVAKFKREYFTIYVLVMASDWLQGPYMYTLYKDEKGLPETIVAALFTTGFVMAGIAATFVDSLADRHGRKAACMSFCILYAGSCLSVLSNTTSVLFVGRALGGISTTLLYSVLESWMISEFHKRGLSASSSLGSLFGASVTLSGVVAIVSGVLGQAAVRYTGTKRTPFMAAVVCLLAAFVGIHQTWMGNYGDLTTQNRQGLQELRSSPANRPILALALATTLFEGSMYLFVFLWSPAIVSSRSLASNDSVPPFGLIFSCFMCAMMFGSLVFSAVKLEDSREAARLLLTILALAATAVLVPVLGRSEAVTFWSFALFEACLGLYFPTMNRLKSDIIEDSVRAKVYGLMRLTLNVFVVVALGLTRDGDAHRAMVFTAMGALMLSAFWVVHPYLI